MKGKAFKPMWRWWSLTNQRLVARMAELLLIMPDGITWQAGIIRKVGRQIPWHAVTNITIRQGLVDRLFGSYNLTVETAGSPLPELVLVGYPAEAVQELQAAWAANNRAAARMTGEHR